MPSYVGFCTVGEMSFYGWVFQMFQNLCTADILFWNWICWTLKKLLYICTDAYAVSLLCSKVCLYGSGMSLHSSEIKFIGFLSLHIYCTVWAYEPPTSGGIRISLNSSGMSRNCSGMSLKHEDEPPRHQDERQQPQQDSRMSLHTAPECAAKAPEWSSQSPEWAAKAPEWSSQSPEWAAKSPEWSSQSPEWVSATPNEPLLL